MFRSQHRRWYGDTISSPRGESRRANPSVLNRTWHRLATSVSATSGPCIQAKLTVGAPNDKYEQEADRVADQVMRMPESQVQRQPLEEEELAVQRQPLEEEEEEEMFQRQPLEEEEEEPLQRQPLEEEEETVQTKHSSTGSSAISSGLSSQVSSLKSGGEALPKDVRSYFEPRFGRNFNEVRIHRDAEGADTARQLNAKAYTTQNHIVFGQGQYMPNTHEGRKLLAHELTHVFQQNGSQHRIQRRTDQVVECTRSNAQACLAHLHGDEPSALQAAEHLYCNNCVNLVHIDNQGCRLLRFDVTAGGQSATCCVDPNRMFDDSLMGLNPAGGWSNRRWRRSWNTWNNPRSSRYRRCACNNNRRRLCTRTAFISAAKTALLNYRNTQLNPALNRCGGRSWRSLPWPLSIFRPFLLSILSPVLPMVAFHANIATPRRRARPQRVGGRCIEPLTILSYCPGHCEQNATYRPTAQRPLTIGGVSVQTNTGCSVTSSSARPVLNPHIERNQNIDDFILVTQPNDFLYFVGQGRNVVLQDPNAPRDGSLSIVLSTGRYINIEAQRGHTTEQEAMGRQALGGLLGVRTTTASCPPQSTHTLCPRCTMQPTSVP